MSADLVTIHPPQGDSSPAVSPGDAHVAPTRDAGMGVAGDERAELAVQVLVLVLLARRLRSPWWSPLAPDHPGGEHPTRLRGGRVDHPGEVAQIAARVAFADLPGWRRGTARLLGRAPVGWRR